MSLSWGAYVEEFLDSPVGHILVVRSLLDGSFCSPRVGTVIGLCTKGREEREGEQKGQDTDRDNTGRTGDVGRKGMPAVLHKARGPTRDLRRPGCSGWDGDSGRWTGDDAPSRPTASGSTRDWPGSGCHSG